MTKLLLEKGANIRAKDNKGLTPLDLVAGTGHTVVAELLAKHLAKKPK
jgi:ankyrin repeat protein